LKPSFANLPVNATGGDEGAFTKGMETLEDQVKFASAIGCSRMMVVIPPATQTPKEELRQTLKRRFEAVGVVLSRHNVRCAFEFLGPLQFRQRAPHEFIWQMNEMVDFAQECGPSFGVVLDVWHWYHSGGTLQDIRRAGKSQIVLLHLSDAAKQPPEEVRDNQRLMAGEGVIDLVGIFKTLREMGWEGSVSPEPIGRIPKEMSAEDGARLGLRSTEELSWLAPELPYEACESGGVNRLLPLPLAQSIANRSGNKAGLAATVDQPITTPQYVPPRPGRGRGEQVLRLGHGREAEVQATPATGDDQ
ncbi:MAG: sugar phosphate isomerase/epimerase family protein, partial [Candidatus Solibacter sp.]